ncbi:hypothetical protein, conserved [Entamoeba dispar SAW760]|uniref:Gamma carbonic anhydrase family protein n=1 Tax=Entamoeba dispar (strain ATCC PRA-260 / SAW760) TaxID=370354 RepID=B0EL86_ENTDS|nr:uncharacterized protein EDI_234920 [Entamoeba dispar SAW760]EDR24700.1 hypothetical protein, conserved [Entamoeba dispar SAW760]|eukprot:EDR24700.1 hypothetical protein, conserved [Entamoeba dispar SAW760]
MSSQQFIPHNGNVPKVAKDAFITPGVFLIGDVEVESKASIWFNAVLRGDMAKIVIGENSNVQDCSVVHTSVGKPTIVGKNVTIGHSVILHSCEIGDGSMIGMGSTILDDVKIGKNVLVGANSLVTSRTVIPDNSLVMGSPAKVVRDLREKEFEYLKENIKEYDDVKQGYHLEQPQNQ